MVASSCYAWATSAAPRERASLAQAQALDVIAVTKNPFYMEHGGTSKAYRRRDRPRFYG